MGAQRIDFYGLYGRQEEIYNDPCRLKILNLGRRWGKTILLIRACCDAIIEGKSVAFYGFNDQTLDDTWNEIRDIFTVNIKGKPLIIDKDEGYKYFKIQNGGNIKFWSSERVRNGRGKKYNLVVCDEVCFYSDPKKLIEETIMATLADFADSQLILASTPHGTGNYWYQTCTSPKQGFKVWTGNLYENPHIPAENIAWLKSITDPQVWQQEYLAEFVDVGGATFFWNYSQSHYTDYEYAFDKTLPTWVVFDFNYDPCCATVYQETPMGVIAMRSFSEKGGTRALCQKIKTSDLLDVPTQMWTITGDMSGTNNSATSGNVNNFDIIQEEFGLADRQIVNVHSRNKSHEYSRVLCNMFLYRVPFAIDKRVKDLHLELQKAKPTSAGKLYKNRKDGHAMDLTDTFRYFVDARFINGLDDINSYVAGMGN